MIPVKLAVTNFMCYRDNVPPLYFDGFQVACLCGDNGHGKSALLDAITWALWGKTRAKSDDDLIHLGQTDMEVEFEFEAAGNRYRILRKRTKVGLRRPGHTLLELQVATEEGFAPVTGNTVQQTQQKITETLRMDYQTFTNSALLLQGRADEFTKKPPSERKRVLADILGLSLYDELERLAKDVRDKKDRGCRELENAVADIDSELDRRDGYQVELAEVQAAMSALASEAQKREEALDELRGAKKALEGRQELYVDLGQRVEQASQQLQYLDTQVARHRSQIERCERVLAGHQQELTSIQKQLEKVAGQEQELGQKRAQAQALSNRIHHLRSTNAQLKEEMNELRKKLDLLGRGEANCPLCGAELGVDGYQRIMVSYQDQGRDKGQAYRVNEKEAQQKEAGLRALERDVGELERAIATERARGERQAEALARDRVEAEKSLPLEKEALRAATEQADLLRSDIGALAEKRNALSAELATFPRLQARLAEAERDYKLLREQRDQVYQALVRVQNNLERCDLLEKTKGEKARALLQTAEERSIYEELALAFGKKGIQALIIESALPEIEDEANRLLGRMTDNRMHLRIESQRDTRKGETVETLEIKISDELGTRSYEMFSGGEAFRVNFALRIALSRLLARRAGAPLPTLFIDEGFGTQDSLGREKLVEAINSIQDDFEKILVITHIEELKDAFPVRIEVTKTEEGSTISMG